MFPLTLLLCLLAPAQAAPRDQKSLASYSVDMSRPVAERITDMPKWLLENWRDMDEAPWYRRHRPSPAERRDFAQAVAGLPPAMRKVLDERLIAVYFITGLKGNGITDWVLDSSSRVFVTMTFNPKAFRQTLSETLTERELSVFQGPAPVLIDAGSGATGMLYSVAHESAHAFDYAAGLTPYVDANSGTALSRPAGVSWDVWQSYGQPRPADDFPARARLRFYGWKPPELAPGEAAAVYGQFSASPFASLYGSKMWAEDAAELFVFHHLTAGLGRPYRIVVGPAAGAQTILEPMTNPRVRARAVKILTPVYGPSVP